MGEDPGLVAAVAQTGSLVWECPYAMCAAKKEKKKKNYLSVLYDLKTEFLEII